MDCPGSVHDSTAFAFSALRAHQEELPAGYYLLGDPAYKAHSQVLVPFKGLACTDSGWEANFSFYHSLLLMDVECAFGMLVQQWGCLWRQLQSRLVHNILVVHSCTVLHN
eukprot:1819854-Rhodomonas_salina.1